MVVISDVEASNLVGGRGASNGQNDASEFGLPPRHPMNIAKRMTVIGCCSWGLISHFGIWNAILHSPRVSHEWFKFGLAGSLLILAIKTYVELYRGRIQRQQVNYVNFKQETHLIMIAILVTSISFHAALWPEYGGLRTMLIMFLFGWGVLLQFILLVPTYVQNAICFILMTFFIQQYA
uniref:Uncharacterized protein n=1 Tax=Attheya septentrionalis TaxID=420275 RepID=A0A7S2U566_9STRA|mmetsp:Transcript_1040/g.1914  ORF Transcript_1040/g.1914 Transcript_1040/m.1914 type:complete len:179 (+) Transcript_1040:165-701(+)|eukprot:CAMPEP_0198292344 /NCGR_PEP_ID=MMETSP1449-20131203/11772_1 /TAXON_ID=420275 /ORGANISM="Attheya septentrionalis, Strain CCMP2084" /LENGTH=178 /DNA_ID=CAMNT_0043991327 /DNA_START=114 /DNA_END=650 /DNA_ORIENTATION=+